MLATPVVLLVFNRPGPTARVLARIREARPAILFVVADGPRPGRPEDAGLCQQVRALIEAGVDWPCNVVRDYADANLGCGPRIASGLTRVFARVEEAIILEDDCLPDASFFPYCAELLARYRDEPRVGLISGSHHQLTSTWEGTSYYFCRYGNIWGWATWRRAWANFDHSMRAWPAWRDSGEFERFFPDARVRAFWRRIWDEAATDPRNTWDYQWTFCYLSQGLLGVLPRVALIENIGFGAAATHTQTGGIAGPGIEPMAFPLRHPDCIEPDLAAEERASRRFFSERSLAERITGRLKRLWPG